MVSLAPATITTPLTVAPLSTHAPMKVPCLRCGVALQLHQPDDDAPQRLLGTCDVCGGWHLIDCEGSVVVLLPDAATLCDTDHGAVP